MMKARVSPPSRLNKKQKVELNKYIHEFGNQVYQKESNKLYIRYLKLMAVALNKKCKFGAKRIMDVFDEVSEISVERANDMIFWHHIDKVVIDQIGLCFERENYNDVGE